MMIGFGSIGDETGNFYESLMNETMCVYPVKDFEYVNVGEYPLF